jgi:ABC-type branched-subunit amino acid transport system substrate-binding protein
MASRTRMLITGVLIAGLAGLSVVGIPSAAGAKSAKLQVGPGVTKDSITLGVLTDQTGPFAAASAGIAQGRQLYWIAKNAQGGVCNRTVKFSINDHAYNAQTATSLYAQQQPNVLAFDELLGSPMIAALLPSIQTDQALTMAVSFSSNLLDNPYVVVTGSTYDIEMINAVQWLVDSGKVKKNDTIGHIYLEGDYGENALAGTMLAADKLGLEVSKQQIQPTTADLTAPVTALDKAGAKVVLLTTTPPQAASAVGVAAAGGTNQYFVGSNPTYSPALMRTAAAGALQKSYVVVQSTAPFASEEPGPTKVRNEFTANFPNATPNQFVNYGYAQGELMAQVLDTACANRDLTRKGLLKAFQSIKSFDSKGLVAPMDFTRPGQPPARQVMVLQPDPAVAGTLSVVAPLFASKLATKFTRDA